MLIRCLSAKTKENKSDKHSLIGRAAFLGHFSHIVTSCVFIRKRRRKRERKEGRGWKEGMGGGRGGGKRRGGRPGPRRAATDAVLWPKTRRVLTVLLAEMESETEDSPALRLSN